MLNSELIVRLVLFLSTLCLLITPIISYPLNSKCDDTAVNLLHSTYQSNLNTLFNVLINNSNVANGYYNFTVGQTPPDIAYGLFLCRGDVSVDVCRDCVSTATVEIKQVCSTSKSVTIWYEKCMLRYSNHSIFSTLDQSFRPVLLTVQNSTANSSIILGLVLGGIIDRASVDSDGKKFAVDAVNLLSFPTIYRMAQCTPDLNSSACRTCLQGVVTAIPNGSDVIQGGWYLSPSCSIRYNVYQFYNDPTTAAAPTPSLVGPTSSPEGRERRKTIIISISISAFLVLALLGSCIYFQARRKREDKARRRSGEAYNSENLEGERNVQSLDIPSIQLNLINKATKHFSEENKLGEGGFGPVYKGILPDGKEVAVKRLSITSSQGRQEFMNEVSLIAKLQHRNLVRLLGCSLEGKESLLLYEYMPNKSLDVFLFDSTKGAQLDWKRRLLIINGIARGLLYLHEDSRLRIIHRDLKASNVLLDHEMNPKISDFGMARIFGGNQSEANTNRVVGTYGYMAPEYAMEGLFSVKSDVFSFGVLLLEIVSGKKNGGFYLSGHGSSLLKFAWKLWCDDQALELMDPLLVPSFVTVEVMKCIQIGLLCVQEDAADRPTMASVVVMLGSRNVTLPQPTQPAFSVGRKVLNVAQSSPKVNIFSVNEVTVSEMIPR